jgi:hypothetical protein
VSEKVKVGQIWQDWDVRVRRATKPRLVEILSVNKERAMVKRTDNGRTSAISLSRFRPNSTGYKRRADLEPTPPMTAPKPTTGSVEERAKIAAKAHHDEYRRKNLNVAINEWSFHLGYLNAAQAEGARRAVEEIEKLVPMVCELCRTKPETFRHFRRPIDPDFFVHAAIGPNEPCLSAHLHAALHRLRAELSAGGTEKGGEG